MLSEISSDSVKAVIGLQLDGTVHDRGTEKDKSGNHFAFLTIPAAVCEHINSAARHL